MIFIIYILNSCVFAQDNIYSVKYLEQCKNYVLQKERFNVIYYNALQMTPEQIDKYEDITESDKNSYKEILSQITHEVQKYQTMKECNFSYLELKNQRQLIKKLYRQIKKASHKEDKLLKKILTREQRSTYNMIKHLERHDLKKNSKNYYKLNPKMSVFGNLKE